MMALGASRKRLLPGLMREVLLLSSLSAVAGALAGIPFVWLLWGLFRLILVDSSQMVLALDARCLLVSAAFFLLGEVPDAGIYIGGAVIILSVVVFSLKGERRREDAA